MLKDAVNPMLSTRPASSVTTNQIGGYVPGAFVRRIQPPTPGEVRRKVGKSGVQGTLPLWNFSAQLWQGDLVLSGNPSFCLVLNANFAFSRIGFGLPSLSMTCIVGSSDYDERGVIRLPAPVSTANLLLNRTQQWYSQGRRTGSQPDR